MSRLLRAGAAPLAVIALAACSGGGSGPSLEEALRQMVLQPEDVPEGFVAQDESVTTNEAAAAGDAERAALLEQWGRRLGYELTFGPAGQALVTSPVVGINVSASLYETEQGAMDSFADAVKTAEETDWSLNYGGLKEFQKDEVQAPSLGDDIMWLRLSGFQTGPGGGDELVTDDLIFFREAKERGFLRVLTRSEETQDRGHYQATVVGWLRALVANVKEALPATEEGS